MKPMRIHWGVVAAACLLAACGGGSKSSTNSAQSTVVAGVASKGPMKSARVTAYRVEANGSRGAKITDGKTDASGNYSLNLGSYTGPVELEMTVIPGETKSADEATGADVDLPTDFKLRANVVASTPTVDVHITPFTELAATLVTAKGGATAANIQAANALVGETYGFNPISTKPIRFDTAPPADATEAQKRYAMMNAAVSKWAQLGDGACKDAATDGAKIKCAVGELSKTVAVATSQSSSEAAVEVKGAPVAEFRKAMEAAAGSQRNKTGIDVGHNIVKDVQRLAEVPPATKITVSTAQNGDDVTTKAKKFFADLRSNAAALETGSVDQGLRTALNAFADTIEGDAATVTSQVGRAVTVADFARQLWEAYTTAGGPNQSTRGRDQCFVMKGTFPGSLSDSVFQADSPASATWVSCSLPFESLAQRMTIRFNFKGAPSLAAVPYTAGSRVVTNGTSAWKPSAASQWSGTVGFTLSSGGDLTGVSFAGDLPPVLDFNGNPLATRYAVNLNAAVSQLASGAVRVAFTGGSLGVVPLNATAVSTTVDIAPASGATEIVQSDDPTNAQQIAASKIILAGRISNAKGEINGRLVVDELEGDFGGNVEGTPRGRYTFTGDMSLTGKGKLLSGSLVGKPVTKGSPLGMVTFEGTLALPSRPQATLKVEMTETGPDKARFDASYEQGGVKVKILVADTGVAEIEGVGIGLAMTVNPDASKVEVKVGGNKAATIDLDKNLIEYVNGSFESI